MEGLCPLKPEMFLKLDRPFGLHHMSLINHHIAAKNCLHPPLKEFVFRGTLEGTTLFLLACHFGEFDSVKHIVECWGVDVRAAATFYPDESELKIETVTPFFIATPLFVAAHNGHSKIVRYLLEKGADPNVKTSSTTHENRFYDGLSPLFGAVSDNWMTPHHHNNHSPDQQRSEKSAIVHSLLEFGADVVSASSTPSKDCYPIWKEEFCGVDATVALINHGMDLSMHHSCKGQTILHYWANFTCGFNEEDSLIIIKLLLDKGADLHAKDDWGLTPILEVAYHIERKQPRNFAILEFLLKRDEISHEEKIEALELAGAVLFADEDGQLLPQAGDYWRRALQLRQIITEGCGPIIKTRLVLLSGGRKEWVTHADLENVIQSPFLYEIQSFLVILRIFSGKSWAAVKFLCDQYCQDDVSLQGRYALILDKSWALLDAIRLFDRHEEGLWEIIVNISYELTLVLSYVQSEGHAAHALWNQENIKRSVELILASDQYHLDDRESLSFNSSWHGSQVLINVTTKLIASLEVKDIKIMQWLFQLMRRDKPEQFGTLLLHEACQDRHSIHYLATIRLVLDAGADPNAVDVYGDAPLHAVARLPQNQRELMDTAVRLLLDAGAHLDRVNRSGMTAADIWIKRNEMEHDQNEDARWNARPDWCRTTRSLSCLTGRVIRSHKVPYLDGDIPATLNPFLEMH